MNVNKPVITLLTAGLVVALAGNAMAQDVAPAQTQSTPPVVYSGALQGWLLAAHNNYAQGGVSVGLFGESKGQDGRGVVGFATAQSGKTFGVIGRNYSPAGGGVYGHAHSAGGNPSGLIGISDAQGGRGVYAEATHPNGINFGLFAQSLSTQGRGVVGVVRATTGVNYGVIGRSFSNQGVGVWAHVPAQTGQTTALRAEANSRDGVGVLAINHGGGLAAHFQGDVRMDGAIFLGGELLCFLLDEGHSLRLDSAGRGEVRLLKQSIVNMVVMPMDQPMPNLHYYLSQDRHPDDGIQPQYVKPSILHVEGGAANGLVKVTVLYKLCPGLVEPQ